jgi:hypothetical protein
VNSRFVSRSSALIATLALQTAAGLAIGFWIFFSRFRVHDDESTFLVWDRLLLQGHALYDEVWSFYGPFPFLVHWLLHGPLGAPLTHEVYRLGSLMLWLVAALLLALTVYRITRRLLPTAFAHALVLLELRPLANEPGHPQGYVAVLIAAAALLASSFDARRPARAAAGFGALLAALVLTKLNAGAYLGVSLALAFALAARGGWSARALRLGAGAAALALPLAVMRLDALRGPWSGFAFGYWIAVGLLAALWLRPPRPGLFALRALLPALASFAAGSVALVAIAMAAFGSSLAALLRSVFVLPAGVPGQLDLGSPASQPGALSLLGSLVLYALLLRLPGVRQTLALAAIQVLYGVGVCALVLTARTGTDGVALPGPALALLWLILLPGRGSDPGSEGAFRRLLLGLLAAAQVLYLYPISGSQLAIAALLMIPCAVICLDDGLRGMALALREVPGSRVLGRAAAALAALALVTATLAYGAQLRAIYAAHVPLQLPGTEHLRLPERSVALYRWISANLKRHCDTYFASPGLAAPYFWADLPVPSRLHASLWFWVFDAAQQQRIRDDLERFPRACALLEERGTAFSLTARREPREPLPLLQYLRRDFATVGTASDGNSTWDFRVRRGRHLARNQLTYQAIPVSAGSRRRESWHELRLELPAFPGERATRFSVVDLDRGVTLADSLPGSPSAQLTWSTRARKTAKRGRPAALNLSQEQSLRLHWHAAPEPGATPGSQVVRVYGTTGELLAPIPVLGRAR